jgi:predicted ester cyclase
MTPDQRKALIRRLFDEVWNQGKLEVTAELFGPAFVSPLPGALAGPEGERQHVAMIRTAFPDLHVAVDELVAEGETVVARGTMTGTNTGVFMGRPPTSKAVSCWGVHIFRFANGRIAECWIGIDMLGMLIQLGITPSPWTDDT